ncbi:NACHT domain-containing protein [Pseudanabaena sp. UWO311]|uniref:NACHT domain-containing protein n=1 Tax=Pseudanabaena sp. UWO311 TaxID=2487337 RepID=UPI0011591680|nr:helix-turn-helix domain-containing protein [Pseudanabaena sp. UWO311]TYQ26439.1 NACHT domain-containing protein [Pseudanabaena sp. UWO311]
MRQQRDRSLHFSPEGIALIEEAMQGKDWDKNQLAEQVEISYESICRYLRGERPPQRKNIEIIAKRLGLKPIDLVNPDEWISSTKASETKTSLVDWRSVSKGMLDNLKRLTTEALTAGDGIRFDFDDIFVPLGVVERQQKTKRKEDDGAPDRGSELYEEKVTPITHKDFFEDVLLRGNTKNSNGKRIAVIGEAGAGKTTQLQKIGSWLLEESDDIPIWISLTDLGTKPLEEFIFENWVRNASGKRTAPQEWKDSLEDAIASGKVWLLLDGVDEMTDSNPLSNLATQLKEGCLNNVRVVLTCRVNVWDSGKVLTGFDVYRNLDFDYPNDVYKFIGKWFVHAPDLAGSLTQALEQSGKERIRDMVKNPLRLTLLCYSWQLKHGELPETKAGLYAWFVEAFYKWNKGKAQIELSRSQEEKLNQALGELAKRAIDGETSRFRLTKTFIENVFRDFDIDLFDLALKLNWLNEIGVAAENPLETVYAFYHPSFQEYFAALAINEHSFFLENKPDDVISGCYKIFESKWLEVALFWIGTYSKARDEKNKLICELAEFKENNYCFIQFRKYFYGYQSIALAARLMAEYIGCSQDDINNVMWQLCQYSFGFFDAETQSWIRFLLPIQECATQALIYSNHTRVKDELDYIKNLLLKAIEIDNHDDIQSFLECNLNCYGSSPSMAHIRFSLDSIDKDETVEFLGSIVFEIEQLLGQIDGINVYTIYKSSNPIESNHQIDKVIESLIKIDFTNPKEIIKLIDSIGDDEIRDDIPFYEWFDINPYLINYCIPKTTKPSLVRAIVGEFSKWFLTTLEDRSSEADCLAYHFLWRCSELMNYKDFYDSWHPKLFKAILDLGCLESQLIDRDAVQEELDRNTVHPEIRCLVVDIRHLEQESNPNVIAEEIAIKIFDSLGRKIPEIQRVSSLKRELLNLKFELGFEKLAIALYGKNANEAIAQLCQNLTDSIPMRSFTGGQTTEELISQINAWLLEM